MTPTLINLVVTLALGTVRVDSDGEPIPYGTPENEPIAGPKVRSPSHASRMAGADDPNLGLHVEGVAGLMLLDSSKGAIVDPNLTLGARIGWNFSRAISSSEDTRYSWYLESLWLYHSSEEGTRSISTRSTQHLISLAPAYALHFDRERRFMLFFQAGGGIAIQDSTLQIEGKSQSLMGLKPLIQYGLSFRGNIPLNTEGSVALALRLDVLRFRRGYLDDTAFAASLGLAF